MRLTELSYKTTDWEIKNLEFDNVSLIVGKNSTGKSKTLGVVDLLGKIITQKVSLLGRGAWNVTFLSEKFGVINYKFETGSTIGDPQVKYERITIGGKIYLQRNSERTTLFSELDKTLQEIYPPEGKLTIHTTRDIRKYPYLEEIINWAEHSYGFKFGVIGPEFPHNLDYNLLNVIDDIPSLYKTLSEERQKQVKSNFGKIGYKIEEIVFAEGSPINFLFIQESDLAKPLGHYQLSQGMFRSLYILIFIEYLLSQKQPATIIIDDLCEGLDYDRATKLGKLLFDNCMQNNIQLIATSNDMFLMDVVDLKYWNLLQREGGIVTALNPKNQPDLFKDFQFTGLSNFDFLASDYIAQKIKK
jgi:AAA15 family ATPase/GTPase